jgi:hypothetical protein
VFPITGGSSSEPANKK